MQPTSLQSLEHIRRVDLPSSHRLPRPIPGARFITSHATPQPLPPFAQLARLKQGTAGVFSCSQLLPEAIRVANINKRRVSINAMWLSLSFVLTVRLFRSQTMHQEDVYARKTGCRSRVLTRSRGLQQGHGQETSHTSESRAGEVSSTSGGGGCSRSSTLGAWWLEGFVSVTFH